jgi:hypothetical protein
MPQVRVGLCAGRHEIVDKSVHAKIEDFVFPNAIENPLDFYHMEKVSKEWIATTKKEVDTKFSHLEIYLYVTGLTPALTSFLNAANEDGLSVTLMHFNRETGIYHAQEMITNEQ